MGTSYSRTNSYTAFPYSKLAYRLTRVRIKHNRYAFCRVAAVGEKAISLLVPSCSEGMVSCPELAHQPFRRSHFHSSENAFSKS